jgi:poly(hydroxyalkanoate) depolymerase family esterase
MTDIATTINAALEKAGLLKGNSAAIAKPRFPIHSWLADQHRGQSLASVPNSSVGSMTNETLSNPGGTRNYRVYVPDANASQRTPPYPLIIMLHGCTQSPEDFAAGTAMNELAQREGFVVAYPEQTVNANGSRCWNWFRPEDQARDRGEPAILAAITRRIMADQAIDPAQVFIAGLSAGAGMAVIMGRLYPELYAGVGAHSGLPYGVAHDVASALSVMKNGREGGGMATPSRKAAAIPTIAFHGAADATVAPENTHAIIAQAVNNYGNLVPSTSKVVSEGRQSAERTLFTDHDNIVRVAHWRLHGVGHAWSGGSAAGSYTAPAGPDASAEMVKFFLRQSR